MDKIEEVLTRGVEKVYPSKKALEKVLKSGKKIKLYLGCDARRPILHLGHSVVLRKLRQLQELGHKVIFLIGDFTTLVGDPSDQKKARGKLTVQQVQENTKTFKRQAAMIVNFEGENPAQMLYNSQWLSELTFTDVLNLASYFTVPQMLERDMFQLRLKEGKTLYLHEILYPLMQAYDSVMMDIDLEIGGTDQTFNMLAGRTLMKVLKNKEKFVLTCKLLTGTDGQKMSKSLNNYIPMLSSASDMFGKIMSMKDELIIQYFELVTDVSLQSIKQYEKSIKQNEANPMDIKKKLAWEIVKMYHGEKEANKAQEEFERVFQKRKFPLKMRTKEMLRGNYPLVNLVYYSGQSRSKTEAKRLIEQGGVEVNGKTVHDPQIKVKIEIGKELVLKVGKLKFLKIKGTGTK